MKIRGKARRHPDWLKVKLPSGPEYNRVRGLLDQYGLNTVCHHARCPNVAECYGNGTATFLILGQHCTRNCRYCNVSHGKPLPPDPREPENIAAVVAALELNFVVITSVTRDDLKDGGARHFAQVVQAIGEQSPSTKTELLIPDFRGEEWPLELILESGPSVMSHNLETVKELFPSARPQGSYDHSLELLKAMGRLAPKIPVKSGLMLGMGESDAQLTGALKDLRTFGVTHLTLGQYLQPSPAYLPVEKYYPPEEFKQWKKRALAMGFSYVESGPLVRSSYHAERGLEG